ncbi:plastocyanin/azurin family copper-binding protein [Amycolatopsis sp. NPDC058986]|uniref:plastocyanin/azurin family copper-binding protein n=1 Tax=unclassified Amycolatopsis TaxID=2618356 RepID=UPI003672A51A
MTKTLGPTILLIAAALGLAACSAPPAATPAKAPSSAMPDMPGMTASSGGPAVATDAVSIKDFAFAPGDVTVKAGATVTWRNEDQDPHTVTSTGNAGPLRSPTLNKGDTYRYVFATPGRYEYLCTIHPFMTATVTVTP